MAKNAISARSNAGKMELTPEMQQHAVSAIEAFGKQEASIKKATDSASKHVLDLFQYALKLAGKEKAEEVFNTLCRHAEKVYSENHSEDIKKLTPVSTLLPFWRVAKSQVLRAFRGGVDLTETKSVYEAVKATPAVKAKKGAGGNAGDNAGTITLKGALGAAVERLWNAVKQVELLGSDEDKAKAADAIAKLAAKLEGEHQQERKAEAA
jgi:hypothetical protein